MKKKKNKQRSKRGKVLFCISFFGTLCIASLVYIGIYYGKQAKAIQQYKEMQELASTKEETSEVALEVQPLEEEEKHPDTTEQLSKVDLSLRKENQVDFEALWNRNGHIYAWIEIPGTQVNYPVLQHPTDDAYYLDHTVDGVSGLPGSIYTESVHPKDFTATNTVLYGHNMKNDSMFGSLHDYESQEALDANPYVYMYLPDKTFIYQIFAASRFSDAYLPEYCDYESEEEFLSYIEEIRTNAVSEDEELEVSFGSRILTLSTCISNDPTHRFLVEAVLIDEYERIQR